MGAGWGEGAIRERAKNESRRADHGVFVLPTSKSRSDMGIALS
jgi:hypothetical protein